MEERCAFEGHELVMNNHQFWNYHHEERREVPRQDDRVSKCRVYANEMEDFHL